MEMRFEYLEKKFSGRIPIKPEEESSRLVKLMGSRRREDEFKTKKFSESLRTVRASRGVKALKETIPERPLPERLISETLPARQVMPENWQGDFLGVQVERMLFGSSWIIALKERSDSASVLIEDWSEEEDGET
ncbi:unnamed protein product [Eruca vesicaria subsp. sativa]|uniref:Uncharacterized protein n=1 Tax=Eruca vesicaria subsp. sativa TaxID=29727 RepID=A0ABC8K7B3_ERUVS|nr:unnamed protein product [Eruca vesicaria subsp. sativa]